MKIVNVAELSPASERFVEIGQDADWFGYSGLPSNFLERKITRPRLSRYRAAMSAALAAKKGVVISHLPAMSAAVATSMWALGRDVPHLAFAFNFTKLPEGRRLAYFKRALARVDNFAVFSAFEKEAYPAYFGLNPERFNVIPWTQSCPRVLNEPGEVQDYVTAIGGEGRDLDSFMRAAEISPGIKHVAITRRYSAPATKIPPNVELLFDLPADSVWSIARRGAAVIVPLKTEKTCCGHITIVSARMLGIPVITSRSLATTEYTQGKATHLFEAGDFRSMAILISGVVSDRKSQRVIASAEISTVNSAYDRRHWQNYIRSKMSELYRP